MESPINILVPMIKGTLVYRGFGSHYIEQRHSKFTLEPIEILLDNEEQNASTLHYLPNGNLCISTCVGDEQPSSELLIIQDWKIEQVIRNVPVMDSEQFARLFDRAPFRTPAMPKKLEHIFNQSGDGKE